MKGRSVNPEKLHVTFCYVCAFVYIFGEESAKHLRDPQRGPWCKTGEELLLVIYISLKKRMLLSPKIWQSREFTGQTRRTEKPCG